MLLDYRTGSVKVLTGPAARWWAELATTGDTHTPTTMDRASERVLLSQLHVAGLLVAVERPRSWPAPVAGRPLKPSWGTQTVDAGRIPIPSVPYRTLPLAAVALVIVLVVAHLGPARFRMARIMRLLTWTTRRMLGPASADRACQAVHAVRRVGLLAPSRVACLEESATVALMLSASRQQVTWCHGVAADPIRLHAWVENDGQPVAEPKSTYRYTALRTIPEQVTGDDQN
ncbi:MAG: lasso peptide biosynthesis B2 protein [Pseudonocardiaceae bacterium]